MPKKLEPAPLSTFGGRLAHWRRLRGFASQGAFAAELGIRQGSLSELESGRSKSPSAEVLVRACELLQLRPRYLWLGEEPAELLNFSDLSGPEAQLVMMFRGLATDAARQGLLIDLHAKQQARGNTPAAPQKATALGGSSFNSASLKGTGTEGK
ncbi:helix-turn-helix domain-containing protein [Pseudorhodoferax sp. Leaf274]|uniref:helix-turn-helix domain-containing protein n=1 Tax=Pseudorhodoferax sp. Leaf274 TaxID=1736318 RepID=UPI00138F20FB|nr:helix-turn-helix transcriptional regulator [Pseudorhodoferax sp. Leaf274]